MANSKPHKMVTPQGKLRVTRALNRMYFHLQATAAGCDRIGRKDLAAELNVMSVQVGKMSDDSYSTRHHPENYCERCQQPNVTWFAPSDLWNKAHGEWDILCPVCFVQLAEAAGIKPTAWCIAPEVL